jgi:predicted transcriptional regulator
VKSPLQQLRQGLTRDQQIVICYKAGNTIDEIAAAFQLTKQRIHQILRVNHCTKQDNPKTRNRELYAFIGTNVPVSVKEAVVKEVRRRKKSISAYLLRLIKDDLSIDMGETP